MAHFTELTWMAADGLGPMTAMSGRPSANPAMRPAKRREPHLDRWPAAYMSKVETWRELPGEIEFTMRRLRSAD